MRDRQHLFIAALVAAILSVTVPAGATAVLVFLRGPKPVAIYLAADSAVFRETQPSGRQRPICKIVHGPQVAVGFAGPARWNFRDARGTLVESVDLLKIAANAAKRGTTPEDVIAAFNLDSQRVVDLLAMQPGTALDVALLELVAAGFVDGTPRVVAIDYIPERDALGRLRIRQAGSKCPPRCPIGVPWTIGKVREDALRDGWIALTRSPAAVPTPLHEATTLLDQQVRVTTDANIIAPPFDVLEITPARMRWLRCKAECRDGCPH